MIGDRKQKKVKKYRGSKTHGCGSMKKRRGAGNRGGRGRAGSGKKADQKKPSYWKEKSSNKGFTSLQQKKGNFKTINVSELNETIHTLEANGLATKKGTDFEVNLKNLGYAKLLGAGKTSYKMQVTVGEASASAVKKIETAGGSVVVLSPKKDEFVEVEETSEAPESVAAEE